MGNEVAWMGTDNAANMQMNNNSRPAKLSLASAYAAGIATSNCTNKIPAQTMTPLSMYLPIGADLRTSLKC